MFSVYVKGLNGTQDLIIKPVDCRYKMTAWGGFDNAEFTYRMAEGSVELGDYVEIYRDGVPVFEGVITDRFVEGNDYKCICRGLCWLYAGNARIFVSMAGFEHWIVRDYSSTYLASKNIYVDKGSASVVFTSEKETNISAGEWAAVITPKLDINIDRLEVVLDSLQYLNMEIRKMDDIGVNEQILYTLNAGQSAGVVINDLGVVGRIQIRAYASSTGSWASRYTAKAYDFRAYSGAGGIEDVILRIKERLDDGHILTPSEVKRLNGDKLDVYNLIGQLDLWEMDDIYELMRMSGYVGGYFEGRRFLYGKPPLFGNTYIIRVDKMLANKMAGKSLDGYFTNVLVKRRSTLTTEEYERSELLFDGLRRWDGVSVQNTTEGETLVNNIYASYDEKSFKGVNVELPQLIERMDGVMVDSGTVKAGDVIVFVGDEELTGVITEVEGDGERVVCSISFKEPDL